jgi:uncharacterized protein (DUF849 family)
MELTQREKELVMDGLRMIHQHVYSQTDIHDLSFDDNMKIIDEVKNLGEKLYRQIKVKEEDKI